jgi:hypothetical protein
MSLLHTTTYAYEVPKVDFSEKKKPTIILFSAESIVVDDVKKYKLLWKTQNTTHVQITFLGNVAVSGSVIITEKEYEHGPITLTATSINNSSTDSKTINKFLKAQREAPVIIKKESKDVNPEFYTRPLPYNTRPINPRRYQRY